MDNYTIRIAKSDEYAEIGRLIIDVYSQLDGFPKPDEQPAYYNLLANIGELTLKPSTQLLVAVSSENTILGCVVYFADMQYYGSGGKATSEQNTSGFRLLAVAPSQRRRGIGKFLSLECIQKAKQNSHHQIIIHSTMAMHTAWKMYEQIGFRRSEDLDFLQGELRVYGFRLLL